MRAGRLAKMLGAVDPDLEVMFEVDDAKLHVVRDAVFRYVRTGERYVQVNVEVDDGPGYREVVEVPFHELNIGDEVADA